jgi:hypothetical protein
MAITMLWYGNGVLKVANQSVNWASDSIKIALLTSSYSFDQDNHTHFGDVSTYEISGPGYTAGGLTIGTKSITYDGPTNETRFLGDDVTWTGATFSCRYAAVYDDTPATGSKWLLGLIDFGATVSVASSAFPVSFTSRKVLKITAA